MTNKYDIHIDAFTFTREICNYEAQCIHKSSIGSTSSFNSRTVFESSPFVEEYHDSQIDPMMNNSASVSAMASNTRGVTADHLSKVWKIDKEIVDRTII